MEKKGNFLLGVKMLLIYVLQFKTNYILFID